MLGIKSYYKIITETKKVTVIRKRENMKILITAINAKYIHSNLGIYDLQSYANAYKEHLQLAEFTINQSVDEIVSAIYKERADVLCLSCYIWNREYVERVATILHKILPKLPIWLGGPEVSYQAEKEIGYWPQIKGIMVGEGEETFLELVRTYVEKTYNFEAIAGLVFKEDEKVVVTKARLPINLSSIPFPYYDKIEDFQHKIIYYESSRGCPFSCSYCLSSVDKRLRFRDLSLVKEELQFFIDHEVEQVKFVDRTFNCNHKHAIEIWKYLLEHDRGRTNFHFEVAADIMTEEEIELIGKMRPGLIQLEIGVQTTNLKTLDEIKRKMDFEKVARVVKRIQEKQNVHQHLDLIAGLPFENYSSFAKSFNEVYQLKPNQLQLGFLKVLKGSYMHFMAEAYECVYHPYPTYEVLETKWISYEELLSLKQIEEMVEVYYNSGQFLNTIDYLVTNYCKRGKDYTPFLFYSHLGEYYEKKSYNKVSHSRIKRYDILLDFVKEEIPFLENNLVDYMMMDLYLRENLKSRPSFAPSIESFKQRIKNWYKKEGKRQDSKSHVEYLFGDWYLFDYERRDKLSYNAFVQKIEVE